MGEIKLFRTENGRAHALAGSAVALERSLQTLLERNLDVTLGIRFLATEYVTGKTHGGRIDTLGLDENNCPVIIEYKRALNENVINQGLFYLDWLLDHRAEFQLLVMNEIGEGVADEIDWSGTRLLCIAADFTKYDEHAVQQINRNIELIRYRKFGDDLLLLDLVNAVTVPAVSGGEATPSPRPGDKPVSERLQALSPELRDVYESLRDFLLALGDDVQEKQLKLYIAFKRIRNFATVEVYRDKLLVFVKLNPDEYPPEEGFSRDVRTIGHWGTGDLELTIRTATDLERAKPLLEASYAGL